MARATRDARRQAVRLGLLTLAASAACAVVQEPPGGPPDFTPPVIMRITPDSGAVLASLDGSARIEFDEVISETSGRGLANLIRLSPRPRELNVDWERTAIAVRPSTGWRTGVVYQLRLLPGVQDLRNNRLDSGRTVIFAVGTDIPDTRLSGLAIDWEGAKPAARATVEAMLMPDSLVYQATADSTGAFVLTQLPRGTYVVSAAVDENNNGMREARERFDSLRLSLDSAANVELWAITQDTIGPAVRNVTWVDSVTLRLELSRSVHSSSLNEVRVEVHALPDTVPVPISALWTMAMLDSALAAQRQAADTIPPDTTATQGGPPPPPPPDSASADSTAAQRVLATRPALLKALVIRMATPLSRGGRYLITIRATSVAGAMAETRRLLVAPAPRDST